MTNFEWGFGSVSEVFVNVSLVLVIGVFSGVMVFVLLVLQCEFNWTMVIVVSI